MKTWVRRFGGDFGLGALLLVILVLIIVPVPVLVIDALLAVNLAVSSLLLMVVMYVPGVVSLSTFPTLLLLTTIFRLSLNIASTKAILLNADAGHVIEAFGNLVVGGNVVVGFVIFTIITVVQFIVIAKGSERVAEVGARFTLDALPGKQMSIDADLRAGAISGDQARAKRDLLAVESALHGGMDGAMKFVKGDAIAGLVITAVNILGGMAIGAWFHGMTVGEAAARFTVLSIGDAMVSQIPSLLISVASGILVTRVSDGEQTDPGSVGVDIGRQLSMNPKPLFLAASFLLCFAAIPGFPTVPFLVMVAIFVALGMSRVRRSQASGTGPAPSLPSLAREGAKPEASRILPKSKAFSSPLEVRLSTALSKSLDVAALDTAVSAERDRLQDSLGVPFPGIDVVADAELADTRYEIRISDVPSGSGDLVPDALLVAADPPGAEVAGLATSHGPAGGMSATSWVAQSRRKDAGDARLLTHEQVVATHVVNELRLRAHLFVGIQEAQWVLERAGREYPNLVSEVVKAMPLLRLADVLRRLLEEQVPVRNMRSILESLVVWGSKEKDNVLLVEYVRGDLGRFLAHRASGGTGRLSVVMVDPSVENAIRQSIKQTPAGNFVALPPEAVQAICESIVGICGADERPGCAVVSSMDVRRYLQKMVERQAPWLRTYSFQELSGHVELVSLGKASI